MQTNVLRWLFALGLGFVRPFIDLYLSCAGGAISSIPQWAVAKKEMMNGTSMASPNACGGIALLLSGLKAQGGFITPNRIRRAIENTAAELGDGDAESMLAAGFGMLQARMLFFL